MNLLSLMTLLLFPLIASLVVGFLIHGEIAIRRMSKIFALGHLVYASLFLFFINPSDGAYQVVQEMLNDGKIWIDTLGISFSLAIDGISLVLILLTCILTLLAIIASKNSIKKTSIISKKRAVEDNIPLFNSDKIHIPAWI